MDQLMETTVQKIVLEPYKHLMKKELDMENIDPGQLTSNIGKGNVVGTALGNSGIPLNITFSEPST